MCPAAKPEIQLLKLSRIEAEKWWSKLDISKYMGVRDDID
jgi:hypothetical protein